LKIGLVSVTFRNEDIPTVFEYAKKAGIDGIEWSVLENHVSEGDGEKCSLIKKLSSETGIEILSLASYCYMDDFCECEKSLETAILLSAPLIRIWAGRRGSAECSMEEYERIVENTTKMARLAKEHSINLAFEYHPNTLTDEADSAVKLIKRIKLENVGLYWQIRPDLTPDENRASLKKVKPYLLGNIHLSNLDAAKGYMPLDEIFSDLCAIFHGERIPDADLLVEFVKGEAPESLIADASTIRKVFDK